RIGRRPEDYAGPMARRRDRDLQRPSHGDEHRPSRSARARRHPSRAWVRGENLSRLLCGLATAGAGGGDNTRTLVGLERVEDDMSRILFFAGVAAGVLLPISKMSAALDPELNKPYQFHIVVRVAAHPQLTETFKERLRSQLQDIWREALGDMADV